jgi:hypothetical protein
MFRYIPAVAVCVTAAIAPLSAQASSYKDPAGRFTMTVPDGWDSAKPDDATTLSIVLAKKKTDASPYEGVCIGIYVELAETKSKTQAEINSLIEGNLTPAFWNDALKGSAGKDVKINSTSNREKDGRKINGVVFTGTSVENGTSTSATGKMELHFIPGSMHTLMCMTETQTWDLASAQLDGIFESYDPKTPALIASISPRGGSVLTMFAGHRYDGVARVLSQDTPNLPAAGWVSTAGSLMVDGGGVWQVCEGVNYAGTCRAVSLGQSAENGSVFAVNSARRLSGPQASDSAAATAFRRSLAEMARRHALR